MRQLTVAEAEKLQYLSSKGVEVALIEPTSTGLKKSILDATKSVRYLLKESGLHDFAVQAQGPDSKRYIKSHLITEEGSLESNATLYRPLTKKGDPRIWFSGMRDFAVAGDILATAAFNGQLWLMNITRFNLESVQHGNAISTFIEEYSMQQSSVAMELLQMLKTISDRGFIPGSLDADTAIGRLLEHELGIKMNSSRNPDYKGIEIKSHRSQRNNRLTLFAQVPDWDISNLKSFKEILAAFGYDRDGIKKLYCTVNVLAPNPQGLQLRINSTEDVLFEDGPGHTAFAGWRLEKLRYRLLEKHRETFWVSAEAKVEDGKEYFHFTKVKHTRSPLLANFVALLETGEITLDHLIKEKGASVSEKGPLFKIQQKSLNILFPKPQIYDLNSLSR